MLEYPMQNCESLRSRVWIHHILRLQILTRVVLRLSRESPKTDRSLDFACLPQCRRLLAELCRAAGQE